MISTTPHRPTVAHMLLHQQLRLAYLSSTQFNPRAVSIDLLFCTFVNDFSPQFSVWSVAASHLFFLSETLCNIYVSVYLTTLNRI